MQELGTDRAFVEDQYSDAAKLRTRIETHQRYSQGDTDRILDDAPRALHLSPALCMLDVGCGAGSWHARAAQAGEARGCGPDAWHDSRGETGRCRSTTDAIVLPVGRPSASVQGRHVRSGAMRWGAVPRPGLRARAARD